MRKSPKDEISEHEEVAGKPQQRAEVARWTHQDPCSDAQENGPEIALYISLHCPRCGQFAAFDMEGGPRRCLLAHGKVHSYLLDRSHHSQNH